MKLLSIGYGNYVSSERVISIVSPDSAPMKRLISEARESGSLIDASGGKKTRSIIIMDTNHIILSSFSPENISDKIEDNDSINANKEQKK